MKENEKLKGEVKELKVALEKEKTGVGAERK